jgi:hypothetical protein
MRQALRPHPESRYEAVRGIEVEVARRGPGQLVLRYVVTGTIGDVRLPPATTPARADGLWQSTCFEAFVRTLPEAGYYELNFAPSRQWAAYRFSAYREDMRIADEIGAPRLDDEGGAELYRLQVSLDLPSGAAWRLALSAVIEEANGRKSYWALAHAPGKPDFHHPDCFALEIPAVA